MLSGMMAKLNVQIDETMTYLLLKTQGNGSLVYKTSFHSIALMIVLV